MAKPNRFKQKPKISTGDISVEEWETMNRKFFGDDNVMDDDREEDSDQTEELNFDY